YRTADALCTRRPPTCWTEALLSRRLRRNDGNTVVDGERLVGAPGGASGARLPHCEERLAQLVGRHVLSFTMRLDQQDDLQVPRGAPRAMAGLGGDRAR